MGWMDNFKKNFGMGGGGAQPGTSDDTSAPNGLHSRPDPGMFTKMLNKKPLFIGGALLALAGGGAYVGLSMLSGKGDKTDTATITPARPVHAQVPPSKPVMPAPAQAAPNKPAAAAAMKSGFTGHQVAEQPAPSTPPKQTPQEKAELAALSGNQGISWQNSQTQNTKAAPGAPAQAGKKAGGESGAGVYNTGLVRRQASAYELMQGDVIPATLTTAIDSDLPGQVTAVVQRNIWDSESGAYLLIPAGAQLVGYYSDKVIAGQTRVGVDWTRIIMPNRTYVNIGTMPGTGPGGKDGFHDEVNDHTWEIFKNALLMSVVDLGISISQPGYGSAGGYGQQAITPAQTGEQSLAQTFGQAEANLLQRYTNVAPTLVIRSGYQMNVAVTKDIVFPGPYNPNLPYVGPVAASSPAPATVMNPYPAGGN